MTFVAVASSVLLVLLGGAGVIAFGSRIFAHMREAFDGYATDFSLLWLDTLALFMCLCLTAVSSALFGHLMSVAAES